MAAKEEEENKEEKKKLLLARLLAEVETYIITPLSPDTKNYLEYSVPTPSKEYPSRSLNAWGSGGTTREKRFWIMILETTCKDDDIVCVGFKSRREQNQYMRVKPPTERKIVFYDDTHFRGSQHFDVLIILHTITSNIIQLFQCVNKKILFQLIHSMHEEEYVDITNVSDEKILEHNEYQKNKLNRIFYIELSLKSFSESGVHMRECIATKQNENPAIKRVVEATGVRRIMTKETKKTKVIL